MNNVVSAVGVTKLLKGLNASKALGPEAILKKLFVCCIFGWVGR